MFCFVCLRSSFFKQVCVHAPKQRNYHSSEWAIVSPMSTYRTYMYTSTYICLGADYVYVYMYI